MEKLTMESTAVKGLQGSLTSLLGKVTKLFKDKKVTWLQIVQALTVTEKYLAEMQQIFKAKA